MKSILSIYNLSSRVCIIPLCFTVKPQVYLCMVIMACCAHAHARYTIVCLCVKSFVATELQNNCC